MVILQYLSENINRFLKDAKYLLLDNISKGLKVHKRKKFVGSLKNIDDKKYYFVRW